MKTYQEVKKLAYDVLYIINPVLDKVKNDDVENIKNVITFENTGFYDIEFKSKLVSTMRIGKPGRSFYDHQEMFPTQFNPTNKCVFFSLCNEKIIYNERSMYSNKRYIINSEEDYFQYSTILQPLELYTNVLCTILTNECHLNSFTLCGNLCGALLNEKF